METVLNIVPLDGANCAIWKIQCKMVLINNGLWNIVNETESVPTEANVYGKYLSWKDRALATIVLFVDPSLLYIIRDPVDSTIIWKKLANQLSWEDLGKQINIEKEIVFS